MNIATEFHKERSSDLKYVDDLISQLNFCTLNLRLFQEREKIEFWRIIGFYIAPKLY